MEHLALDGFWLVGGILLAAVVGIFVAQYVKDTIKGVPSPLRAALSATETDALASLKVAEIKVVTDLAGLFAKATAKPVAPVAPVAAAPIAPVAPAAT